jgi:hypothetical protein
MAQEKEVPVRTDDLDDKSKSRIKEALNAAGLKMTEATGGGAKVIPASQGTIESTVKLDTDGLDDDAINKLRTTAYAADRGSRVLDSVLRSALAGYGLKGGLQDGDFLQWVWCQWQQFRIYEEFMKRYELRPSEATITAAKQAAQTGSGW